MSKYTTEVRFICETNAGLTNSSGCNNVDDILDKCWNKIFTTKTPFFDENYRSVLCKKILKHYYLREIGAETVGIWKLWINTRLEEIMPYYNQLYESANIEFNPITDVNYTRKIDRQVDKNNTETGETSETNKLDTSSTGTSSGTNNNTRNDLYADTPQGAITDLQTMKYLTNARIITDSGSDSNNSSSTGKSSGSIDSTSSTTGKVNSVEEYIETITGKQGTENYSTMIKKFRETLLNIDMKVINEFEDLFFGLW